MKSEKIQIGQIPALLWGEPAERLLVAVHGDMSHKADEVIGILAQEATGLGYRVLSFDLPEHGDRRVPVGARAAQYSVRDVGAVMAYARSVSDRLSLFACSLGAWLSLAACQEEALERCLFLSPVVDLQRLIENMMLWSGVDEERLREEREIPTSMGKTLYWDYYDYVREHQINRWKAPTAILRGEGDTLSERIVVEGFVQRFGCALTELAGGEHFFHTPEQLAFFGRWVGEQLGES